MWGFLVYVEVIDFARQIIFCGFQKMWKTTRQRLECRYLFGGFRENPFKTKRHFDFFDFGIEKGNQEIKVDCVLIGSEGTAQSMYFDFFEKVKTELRFKRIFAKSAEMRARKGPLATGFHFFWNFQNFLCLETFFKAKKILKIPEKVENR